MARDRRPRPAGAATSATRQEGCRAWIDQDGDRDGDGWQESATRSPVGYENMAWKDAGDSVMYADGTPVRGPKALCELQGYVYDAWLRMAEVFDALGEARARARAAREGRGACSDGSTTRSGTRKSGSMPICWMATSGR